MVSKVIKQEQLTSDCWTIQFWGLDACRCCEFKGSVECGGGKTLKKMQKDAEKA